MHCTTRLGPHTLAPGLLQRRPCRSSSRNTAPLQRVLHAAARLVLDLKPYDHVWFRPSVVALFICRATNRFLVHNALTDQSPDYITDLEMWVFFYRERSDELATVRGIGYRQS